MKITMNLPPVINSNDSMVSLYNVVKRQEENLEMHYPGLKNFEVCITYYSGYRNSTATVTTDWSFSEENSSIGIWLTYYKLEKQPDIAKICNELSDVLRQVLTAA